KEGKDVFLFGGGILIDAFLKADIIDEYIIGIIPTILGEGRPLFLGNHPKIDLSLQEFVTEDGIVILRYSRRKN
ncbi:MAG: dihydrofolate reductase family protein, partial [Candidatus Cellulosilyticum pullistercoris]|nr:dihydrofolate reductase family protein [Candidatus Cellulosilyticum pullistercoris]